MVSINRTLWFLFVVLAFCIGIYPLVYIFMPSNVGLLGSKPTELLNDNLWKFALYTHMSAGGLSLLVGWSQFSTKIRNSRIKLHRNLGKIYLLAVLSSGVAALYMSFFATGGFIPGLGFFSLGLIWLSTTGKAYAAILKNNQITHQKFMILSFACTFAAVTLRLWNPILIGALGDFNLAYKIVSWLCWVPNLAVALYLVKRKGL